MRRRDDQRGVALITALLVVALATTVAVATASWQRLDIRRTGNVLHSEQAYQYALGAEGWGRHILAEDDDDIDHLGDEWAQVLPPMSVEGGQVSGYIEDMQGRFNINNIYQSQSQSQSQSQGQGQGQGQGQSQGASQTPAGQTDANAAELERFQRLLAVLEIEPTLALAVLDWIDPDINPRFPEGAEDDAYLQEKPPYRTGNGPMRSASELRLVRGFDAETYARIAPYICALPQPTPININTAKAPVIAALVDGMGLDEAEALTEARGEDGFESVDQFLSHDAFAGRDVDAQGLSVTSEYFLLTAHVEVGRGRARLHSLIHRSAQGPGGNRAPQGDTDQPGVGAGGAGAAPVVRRTQGAF